MSNVNNMRAIISLKKNLVKTRFYCMLIIVKTIATFSKVKCSALTLVMIPFLFSQLVVISVKNVTLSMKISQKYQKQVTIHVLLLLHALVKFSISCGKSIIYHQKLPYTFGVTGVQANSDRDTFLLWFLK